MQFQVIRFYSALGDSSCEENRLGDRPQSTLDRGSGLIPAQEILSRCFALPVGARQGPHRHRRRVRLVARERRCSLVRRPMEESGGESRICRIGDDGRTHGNEFTESRS